MVRMTSGWEDWKPRSGMQKVAGGKSILAIGLPVFSLFETAMLSKRSQAPLTQVLLRVDSQ
jgi:hypothetical protein